MYLNKATIVGNLTRDPELKALPSGMSVASFGLATNFTFKDSGGEQKETTEFHNIVVFGKQAETCARYLKKGSQALVEGRLQTRSWEKDGQKLSRTEIVAERVQFGSRRHGESDETQAKVKAPKEMREPEYPTEEIKPEDIPF